MSLMRVFGVFLTGVDYGVVVQSSAYNWSYIAAYHRFWVELGFVEFCSSYLFKLPVFIELFI